MLEKILLTLHIACAILIISFILINKGKGSEIGATFGNSQESIFGSQGSNSLLKKIIIALSIIFVIINFSMTNMYKNNTQIEKSQAIDLSIYENITNNLPEDTIKN
ncbi:MAG TPA: preprotein translocase subunit SecG [Candidatus Azoamicus sp. OHIO1]